MNARLVAFGSGVVFAVGLAAAGMLDTRAVIGFLDVAHWDPRLVFVMGGAIAVMFPVHRLVVARTNADVLHDVYKLPSAPVLDARLLLGAAMFGVGWALIGYCPGPAIVSFGASFVGVGAHSAVPFAIAMIVGMFAHRLVAKLLERRAQEGRGA